MTAGSKWGPPGTGLFGEVFFPLRGPDAISRRAPSFPRAPNGGISFPLSPRRVATDGVPVRMSFLPLPVDIGPSVYTSVPEGDPDRPAGGPIVGPTDFDSGLLHARPPWFGRGFPSLDLAMWSMSVMILGGGEIGRRLLVLAPASVAWEVAAVSCRSGSGWSACVTAGPKSLVGKLPRQGPPVLAFS